MYKLSYNKLTKKIFKSVLTTVKNNILSGKSVLNISLPVNIFKK